MLSYLALAVGLILPQALPFALPWHACAAVWVLLASVRRALGFGRPALLLWLLAGLGWSAWRIDSRLADQLPPEWEGQPVEVSGTVRGLPQRDGAFSRFDFAVDTIQTTGATLPPFLSLSDYGGRDWPAGSRWRLSVRLKRLHGLANPYGFDQEGWLLAQNRLASGNVKWRAALPAAMFDPQASLDRLRQRLCERVERVLGDRPYGGVILALTLGEQRRIPSAQWELFRQTGIIHLVSISGVHLTLAAGLVAWLAGRCARRWGRGRLPPRVAAATAGLLAATAYALLAGFSVPTQRSLYMLAAVAWALLRREWWSGRKVWLFALLAVLIPDPWAARSLGFWLSFGLIGAFLLAAGGRLALPGKLAGWSRTQWAASVASIPPLAASFGQLPLASPLANLIAVPLIGGGVTCAALAALCQPYDAPLLWVEQGLQWAMRPVEAMGGWPVWRQPHADTAGLLSGLAGAVLLLLPIALRLWPLGLLLLLPLLFPVPGRPAPGQARLTMLDVGQGLAVVVETAEHTLLYDTGPAAGRSDAAARVVLPYLAGRNLRRLDLLMLSHSDSDHAGGWKTVLAGVAVQRVASSQPEAFPLQNGRTARCEAGQRWSWDGVGFELLWPPPERPDWSDNDGSCVLRVSTAGGSVLLTGDIERRAEAALLPAPSIASDVLVAPHHGSRSSSTGAFLQAVAPKHVLVSAGYRNRYRHPHADVWQRYVAQGATPWRTDRDGALMVELGGTVRIGAWREVSPRFWYGERR